MSQVTLKRLIGTALVDREFCDGLMNGKRRTLLAGFNLTAEEHAVIASSKAESVQELASSVHDWLKDQETPILSRMDCNTVQAL
jgi:hypothetical protein